MHPLKAVTPCWDSCFSAGRSDKLPRLQLTAALLQDSGWYLPRSSAMPPLDFGAGAGCSWLGSSAGAWAAGRPGQQLYCNAPQDAAVNGEDLHPAAEESKGKLMA
jgi:hypothetical protein